MQESEVRFDTTNVQFLEGQFGQITMVLDRNFQPKRLILEGNVKNWLLFGIGVNATLNKLGLPGEVFAPEVGGIIDVPPVNKGDSLRVLVDYIGKLPEGEPFRGKIVGIDIV